MQDRKNDFEILDRYQEFSAEIVRLSLLAPGSVAFFIALAGHDTEGVKIKAILQNVSALLGSSFVCFGAAILLGLGHRYLSTDAVTCLIQRDRKLEQGDEQGAKTARTEMLDQLDASGRVLFFSAFFLAIGAILLLAAFYKAIQSPATN